MLKEVCEFILGVEESGVGEENSVEESNAVDGGKKDMPVSLKIAMEKAEKYKKNKGVEISETNQAEKTSDVDPIKLAFNKAKAYKESIKSNSDLGVEQSGVGEENSVKESNAVDGGKKDVSVSLKIA
ncbi:putative transmembrane protein, partial [Trifolium medium]|nr:putative transmembrane protein [Trifolium medium]